MIASKGQKSVGRRGQQIATQTESGIPQVEMTLARPLDAPRRCRHVECACLEFLSPRLSYLKSAKQLP